MARAYSITAAIEEPLEKQLWKTTDKLHKSVGKVKV